MAEYDEPPRPNSAGTAVLRSVYDKDCTYFCCFLTLRSKRDGRTHPRRIDVSPELGLVLRIWGNEVAELEG